MARILKETISFKDAMDNLSTLASLDLNAPGPIGVLGKQRIVVDEKEFPQVEIRWLSGEGAGELLEVLDATFHAIRDHLIHFSTSPDMDWEDARSRASIASMVALAGEAATRLEKYLEIRLGKGGEPISHCKSLLSLQHFYESQCAPHMTEDTPHEVDDMELKDMEIVRRDQEYELFYVRKEDGSSYFSRELFRHMRLICDIESDGDSFEEDPLLQVRAMLDRDLQATAGQILERSHTYIADFFKTYRSISDSDLATALSYASIALLLTANPRNLLQNTSGKTCQQYFEDFHRFLRTALATAEYQKFIAYPPEKGETIPQLLLSLTHALCYEFFHRKGGVKQEAIGLVHRTARKGEGKAKDKKEGASPWNLLLFEDDHYRSRLAKFPSGPLFKILDLMRQEGGGREPFDSIKQGNFPMHLFEIELRGANVAVLRLPSPTRQFMINKVEILDEMRGLLRYYKEASPEKKHLLINLQDRTSWRECTRSKALEELQKNAEFSSCLQVITIPKDTDFYLQNHEYLDLNEATAFMEAFMAQLEAPQECGFFLPPALKVDDLLQFAKSALPLIHRHFFQKKGTLQRREREDFIEIFYQFLALKWIDQLHPSSISFTCKDAVDTGAAASACFFAFLKFLSSGFNDKSDLDYCRWLFYAPALFVRERPIDAERMNRALTALERMDTAIQEDKQAILRDFAPLYHPKLFKSLSLLKH